MTEENATHKFDVASLKELTLLYVEDDDDIREELARYLRRRSGNLWTAVNGQEGLELFRQHRPDVVVTDIMMPVMDGLRMAVEIKAIDYDTPVVVTTAFNDYDLLLKAIDAGIDKYVLKPIDVESLLEAIYKAAQIVFQRREIVSRDEKLHLAATVFEASSEGIMITDADNNIVTANRAFTEITGYAEEEVRGKNPRLLNSGRQEREFYHAMWESLKLHGHWQGEIWNRRKNGELYPEWLVINVVRNGGGEISHYIAVFSDISQRKYDEERIAYLAHYDPLTDLPNRVLFQDQLGRLLVSSHRQEKPVAVLLLDLDRFKNVNESLGHIFGDQLLQQVAQRLRSVVHEEDLVARLGGDEYVVVLSDLGEAQNAALVAQKILDGFALPFSVDAQEISITASIGVSLYPDDGDSPDVLLKNAESAMYGAKQSGRNSYRFYTQSMNASVLSLLKMENAMHHALERGEFLLHYQPQVDIMTGRIIGMEALIRWQHPERGMVPPMEFIPLAEESGFIIPIGEWVLREACRQAKLWHDAGYRDLCVAVNLSAVQFKQSNLTDVIQGAAEAVGLDLRCLELELTESLVMHNAEDVIKTLRQLKSLNLQLSIDDFGTGYSSMSYLKRFPVDKLKIDQSFIRDISDDPADLAISQAIIALGHSLGLRVIAEGVETAAQLALLNANRCDEMQGYYFSKPVDAAAFTKLLDEGRTLDIPKD
ncbi:MAG: putative bifunctional diguanylate cyclase/phosphodiesterase [Sulfuricellaceae bacterium]|jgi:diguanylate cyclase (GGDEF)-like protein/PAS domain S-box-containing protein